MAKNAPVLQCRGEVIAQWASHLARVHPELEINADSFRAWTDLGKGGQSCVPEELITSVMYPATDSDANNIITAFHSTRSGYTRTGLFDEENADDAAGAYGGTPDQQQPGAGVPVGNMHGLLAAEVEVNTALQYDVNGAVAAEFAQRQAQAQPGSAADATARDPGGPTDPMATSDGGVSDDDMDEQLDAASTAAGDARNVASGSGSAPQPPPPAPAGPSSAPASFAQQLRDGAAVVLAPAREQRPCDDFNPNFMPRAHPCTFPHGCGGPPAKMSYEFWCELILCRFPREQHAQNVSMVLDMFNISQRHATLAQSSVQMRLSPALIPQLAQLTTAEFQTATRLLTSGISGAELYAELQAAGPAVRMFMSTIRSCSKRVLGSPASFAGLRSRAAAACGLYGAWTCFITINPAELSTELAFALSGHPHEFDVAGNPIDAVNCPEATKPSTQVCGACCTHKLVRNAASYQSSSLLWLDLPTAFEMLENITQRRH